MNGAKSTGDWNWHPGRLSKTVNPVLTILIPFPHVRAHMHIPRQFRPQEAKGRPQLHSNIHPNLLFKNLFDWLPSVGSALFRRSSVCWWRHQSRFLCSVSLNGLSWRQISGGVWFFQEALWNAARRPDWELDMISGWKTFTPSEPNPEMKLGKVGEWAGRERKRGRDRETKS